MAQCNKDEIQNTAKTLIKKAKAMENRRNRQLYLNAAILGTYGWNISVPVIIGVIIGRWLDKKFPLPPMSWTLNLILIGFIIGFYNAQRWINKEGVIRNMRAKKKALEKMNRKKDTKNV